MALSLARNGKNGPELKSYAKISKVLGVWQELLARYYPWDGGLMTMLMEGMKCVGEGKTPRT